MNRGIVIGAAACMAAMALVPLAAHAATKPPVVQCLSARGKSQHKTESQCMRVVHNDVTRTYRVYKPRAPTTAKSAAQKPPAKPAPVQPPMPVLLVLHGGGGSGSTMEQMTLGQFNRIADRRRVVIVYPDGADRNWNLDHSSTVATEEPPADDIEFLRAVVDDIEKRLPATQSINRRRIYATGISHGGLLSYRLACEAADFVAAVAPVAANLPTALTRECRPARTVPIAIVNGTDDPQMPWLGGETGALLNKLGVLSAQETFEYWAKLGDCALPNTHMQFKDKSAKGTAVIRHVARDCVDAAEVRLHEIVGGGHAWPGGYQYLSERVVGRTSRDLTASTMIWEFLSRFSLPASE